MSQTETAETTIVAFDFVVCRFCLKSDVDDLTEIYGKVAGTSDIVSVETTIRNTLNLLQIQISLNDDYPNYICSGCRGVLTSVQHFRNVANQSLYALDRAKVLKQFPDVQFGGAPREEERPSEEESSEISNNEELIEENVEQTTIKKDNSEEYVEINVENNEQTLYSNDTEGFIKEEIVEQIPSEVDPAESNCAETEWVFPEDEDDSNIVEEDGYLEEEYLDETSEEAQQLIANKQCPICGVTSTAMAVHMRMHTNTRPFKCEICRKGFYTSSKLREHMDSVHEGKRSYRCDVCQKAFAQRKTLNAHLLTHLSDPDKSFVCTRCPKSFLFRWALVKHERTHTGERPFVCTLDGCGKSFASSSNLRQHHKTNAHWKLPRQDTCHVCGKVFQTKFHLKTHLKTHEKKVAAKKG